MQKGGEGDGKIMANVPNIVLFWVTLPSISFKQFPCRVSQQMTKRAWSCPGEVYGVDINTGNSGALYADSFVLHEHYR